MVDVETIPVLLALRRETDPDLPAIVAEDATLTYANLDGASAAVAARLVGAGVVKGDRVGLLALNSAEWATVAYGVMRVGAVLVPLSTLLRPPELIAQISTAGISHLIAAREARGRRHLDELSTALGSDVRSVLDSGGRDATIPALRRAWDIDALPDAPAPQAVARAMEDRVRPSDDMVVLFTSGSTAVPKGTIHTHGGGLRATAAGLDARRVTAGERLYIPMPFFWTGGFGTGLLSAALAGATLLTEADPEPERTLRLLERERVTLFRGWPDQAVKLAADPAFDQVDLSTLGDGSLAALLPADRRPAPGARPNLFGMTESFGPYCGDRLDTDLPEDRWGSCGRPFDGVQVRIVHPDTGETRPAGEEGEIWLRGPNMLRGICGRLRSDVFTPDGWFRTGDRGVLDEAGYLRHRGRLDDMFKVKGATVYPSEVETALRDLAEVRQAYVTDVDTSDGSASEVGALVLTDDDLDAVRLAAKANLSAFKVPTRWLLTADPADVPMTATGKVDKRALRALFAKEGA